MAAEVADTWVVAVEWGAVAGTWAAAVVEADIMAAELVAVADTTA
jgi:hypothetical protein